MASPHELTLEEYREIFNLPTHLICVIDPQGRFHKVNPAQKHMLGWEMEEMIGKPVASFVHPEDAGPTAEGIGRLYEGEPLIKDFRNRCIHRDGSYRWISWTGTLANGLIYAIGSDVTAQVEAQDALERERRNFRRIHDASLVGIIQWDSTGRIHDANDRFLDIVGYSRPDLEAGAINWARMTPPEYAQLDREVLKQIRETGTSKLFEKEYIRKDGTRVPVLIAGVGFDDDGTAGVAVIIDNSTQKRAQAELQMAVRIRDEFLSIASHELKTPLTTLSLQSQLKRRRFENGDLLGAAPERVEKMLDTESRQLDRLTRLIDDMLDISRLSSGRLAIRSEPLDLSELVRSVTESVRPQFEAQKTRLVTHVSPGVRIEGDAFRIEQAVMNLITNALKYGRREPVEIRLEQVDHHARIDVRDRGRGIAPEDLERIFQRFERAGHSGDVPGLGLGLYISREIVRGHGGTIAVQSRPGEGSTFTIALPIAGEKKEAGSPS